MREPLMEYLDTGRVVPLSELPTSDLRDIVRGHLEWTPDEFESDRACTVAIAARILRERE